MLPSPLLRLIALLLVWFSVSGFSTGARLLAPDADLWTRWEAHDPASQQSLDHSPWQSFLDRYRQDGTGDDAVRVAYDRVDEDGRALLESYLASLSAVSVSTLNRAEQFAYWVNLYNALTVRVVLEAYPVDSIRDIDISPGFFASGPWGAKLIAVEGEELTLNDIEHRILRPIWQDPRVHYVVNCASIGCPDLPEQALSAQNAEAVMQQAARSYINSSRGVRIRGEKVTVSSIYDWFYDDFGVRDRDVFNHLLDFAEPELRKNLEAIGEISGTDYDWSLNDAS
ncbi:DUF547 domain-containing protein [Kiloniella sp. b19]|uniref:DUF547 domain-containing protein n=1 Tax=Kiloniella sp. GXU_MW_B19 TaxID=3141326 RepID=UPI0031D90DFD